MVFTFVSSVSLNVDIFGTSSNIVLKQSHLHILHDLQLKFYSIYRQIHARNMSNTISKRRRETLKQIRLQPLNSSFVRQFTQVQLGFNQSQQLFPGQENEFKDLSFSFLFFFFQFSSRFVPPPSPLKMGDLFWQFLSIHTYSYLFSRKKTLNEE